MELPTKFDDEIFSLVIPLENTDLTYCWWKIYWFFIIIFILYKILSKITSKTYSIAISIKYYQWIFANFLVLEMI